jgi:hypothetical protein
MDTDDEFLRELEEAMTRPLQDGIPTNHWICGTALNILARSL